MRRVLVFGGIALVFGIAAGAPALQRSGNG
jgi:hypothetical protein